MYSILKDFQLKNKVECSVFTCSINVPCDYISLPSFRISLSSTYTDNAGNDHMEQQYFEIPREALLIPDHHASYTLFSHDKCHFAFSGDLPVGSNSVILGANFMRNFYTVLSVDMDGGEKGLAKIGISKNVNG